LPESGISARGKKRDSFPHNSSRPGRVDLSPGIVDRIAFWTKNPALMFGGFEEIDLIGHLLVVHLVLIPLPSQT